MRLRPALLVLPALIVLAGCSPAPAPSPTETATSTPKATITPSPSPSPSPTATPTAGEFTKAELIALCVEKIRPLAPNATFFTDMATTEWLDAPSVWFVLVPKTADGQDSVAVCGIGGTPAAPEFALSGETLPDGVAQIRDDLLSGNDGGEH